jgi:hypothetical protein
LAPCGGGLVKRLHQRLDPLANLVSDPSDGIQVLARRILQIPVLVALAGVDRADVAAAHRDHHVRLAHHALLEPLRPLGRDIDPGLLDRLDDCGVESIGGFAARRGDLNTTLREALQERRRHLAAPGVVAADEEDLGNALGHGTESKRLTFLY